LEQTKQADPERWRGEKWVFDEPEPIIEEIVIKSE